MVKLDPHAVHKIAAERPHSVKQLANHFSVSATTMRKFLDRHSIPYRVRQFGLGSSLTDEQKARIVELFHDGVALRKIAEMVGVGHSTVEGYIRSLGLRRDKSRAAAMAAARERKAQVAALVADGRTTREIAAATGLGMQRAWELKAEVTGSDLKWTPPASWHEIIERHLARVFPWSA